MSAAIWFLIGVTTLDVSLFTALAGGAAPVLRQIGALPVVEIVGGVALVWGGVTSLREAEPRRDPGLKVDIENCSGFGSFLLGLVVAAGNPHYWIWWVTAGLAFVEAARAHGARAWSGCWAPWSAAWFAGTSRCSGHCTAALRCSRPGPSTW